MIRFYRHDEINRALWDDCVKSSPAATWFSEYDILTVANAEWAALIDDNYSTVMPLPWRSKHGLRYIYNPFYYSRLGIFSAQAITRERVTEFMQSIPKSFVSIDLNLNESNPDTAAMPSNLLKVSHRLNLSASYEEISKGYANNHRRNIKSARNVEPLLDTNLQEEEVIALFRSSSRGRDKGVKMRDVDYSIFLSLCKVAREQNLLEVWGARDADGGVLAGAVFLRDHQRVWFWASGRDEGHADRKAMFFLMDEYIRQHAQQPLELDFNGSSNESVARFYAGFGGKRYTFPAISILHNPLTRPILHFYRKIK